MSLAFISGWKMLSWLMRNGFDAPPEVLLKRFLDVDLHDTRLVSNALSVVEDKIDLLEKGYQK